MNEDFIRQYMFIQSGISQIYRKAREEKKEWLKSQGHTEGTFEELEALALDMAQGEVVVTELGTLQPVPVPIFQHTGSKQIGTRYRAHFTPKGGTNE